MLSLGPPRAAALVVSLALIEVVLPQTCTQPPETSELGGIELVLWIIMFQGRETLFYPCLEANPRDLGASCVIVRLVAL